MLPVIIHKLSQSEHPYASLLGRKESIDLILLQTLYHSSNLTAPTTFPLLKSLSSSSLGTKNPKQTRIPSYNNQTHFPGIKPPRIR